MLEHAVGTVSNAPEMMTVVLLEHPRMDLGQGQGHVQQAMQMEQESCSQENSLQVGSAPFASLIGDSLTAVMTVHFFVQNCAGAEVLLEVSVTDCSFESRR